MADPKKIEKGKSFLEKVLAQVPEDKRAAVAEALQNEAVLEEVGAGVLRQDEFSRRMGEADEKWTKSEAWQGRLNTWWNDRQAEIEKLKVENALLKEGKTPSGDGGSGGTGNEPPIKSPAVDLTGFVKKEDFDRAVAEAEQRAIPLVTTINKYSLTHFKEFGEVLDTDALIAHCRKTGLPIDRGGYESFAKEKIDAKAAESHKAEIDAAEKRGEERARAAIGAQLPYPVGAQEPTTLDGLNPKKDGPAYGVVAAVAEFNNLIAKRAGA